MCMRNFTDYHPKKTSKIKAYKVLQRTITRNGRVQWVTPYQRARVMGASMSASAAPEFHKDSWNVELYGGVIHCYRNKRAAERNHLVRHKLMTVRYKVFQIWGEGFVACNNTQIAFKKIYFLEEDLPILLPHKYGGKHAVRA